MLLRKKENKWAYSFSSLEYNILCVYISIFLNYPYLHLFIYHSRLFFKIFTFLLKDLINSIQPQFFPPIFLVYIFFLYLCCNLIPISSFLHQLTPHCIFLYWSLISTTSIFPVAVTKNGRATIVVGLEG